MARSRKSKSVTEVPATLIAAIVVEVAASTQMPDVFDGAIAAQQKREVKHDPSGRYPGREKLPSDDLLHIIEPKPFPSRITEPAGDHLLHMIDHGNAVGYGVKIEGEKPSPEVLAPLKEQREYNGKPKDGLKWAPQAKEWGKRPSGNYVGDRLEIEGRHADAVKAARQEAAERKR